MVVQLPARFLNIHDRPARASLNDIGAVARHRNKRVSTHQGCGHAFMLGCLMESFAVNHLATPVNLGSTDVHCADGVIRIEGV